MFAKCIKYLVSSDSYRVGSYCDHVLISEIVINDSSADYLNFTMRCKEQNGTQCIVQRIYSGPYEIELLAL